VTRPISSNSREIKRLARELNISIPYAWGLCECLWESPYWLGKPLIGDSLDMKLAAQWPGEERVFAAALLAAGLIEMVAPNQYVARDRHERGAHPDSKRRA
jgi:hypothetical protein